MDENHNQVTKLNILMGRRQGNSVGRTFPVGSALVFPNCEYYVVKLWMFGSQSFFMAQKRNDPTAFTLFARKLVQPDGQVKLLNPVGRARLHPELPDFIRVQLNLLHFPFYIELLPSNAAEQVAQLVG